MAPVVRELSLAWVFAIGSCVKVHGGSDAFGSKINASLHSISHTLSEVRILCKATGGLRSAGGRSGEMGTVRLRSGQTRAEEGGLAADGGVEPKSTEQPEGPGSRRRAGWSRLLLACRELCSSKAKFYLSCSVHVMIFFLKR